MEGSGVLAIVYLVLGASVGSFLNVVADRVSAGQSLVRPRSACPSCKHPLSNLDLIPLISYLWLRGRCRYCAARIPVRLLAVEAVAGLLFTAIFLKFGFGLDFVVLAAATSLLIVVAVIDLEHGLILNRIVFPSVAVFLIVAPFWSQLGFARTFPASSGMIASSANSLAAGGAAFLVFLLIALAYPQGMGGGDVKYAGLLGLMLGIPGVVVALWTAVVTGGLVAIYLLVRGKKGRKEAIPFGPFMSLGGIAVLLAGEEIVTGYQT